MSGSLGYKKVFRRQQLLQKWQINDTGFLELEINCQKFLNLSCALGHLQRHLEALELWLFGCVEVPLLFLQKRRFLHLPPPCHVLICTAGSDVTELSQSLVWLFAFYWQIILIEKVFLESGLEVFVIGMKRKHNEPWQQFQVSWYARFCFSQLWQIREGESGTKQVTFPLCIWGLICYGFLAQMPILISEFLYLTFQEWWHGPIFLWELFLQSLFMWVCVCVRDPVLTVPT